MTGVQTCALPISASRLVPAEAVHAFAAAGTIQQCCDKLVAYRDAGLKEVVLLLAGTIDDQRYGLSVIRELQGA